MLISRLRPPSGGKFLVGYTLFAVMLGALLVLLHSNEALLIILAGPIVFAAFFYSRRVYLTMVLATAVVGLLVISGNPRSVVSSVDTVIVLLITTMIMSEVSHLFMSAQGRNERMLRDSEERYRRLVELSPDAIIIHCEGKIVYVNSAGANLLGASSTDALIGQIVMAPVHPDSQAVVEERIRLVLNQGIQAPLEEEKWIRLDGTVISVEVGAIPFTHQGKPAIQVIARDITERKRAEEALRRHDAILEAVSFAAERFLKTDAWDQSAMEILDRLGRATGVSRVYIYKIRRAPDGAAIGEKTFIWLSPGAAAFPILPQTIEARAESAAEVAAALSRGELVHLTSKEYSPAQQTLFGILGTKSLIIVPIFVAQQWWGFIGFDDCIQERSWSQAEIDALKAAAGALSAAIQHNQTEDARLRMATILESTTDFVSISTVNGRLLFVNGAGRHMLGISEGTDVSRLSTSDCYPEWAQHVIEATAIPQAVASGVWSGETAFISPEGREIPVSLVVIAHKSQGGHVEYLSTVGRDISERKRFELQLVELAHHDTLTGLHNRHHFQEELKRFVEEAQAADEHGALLFLDLDNFKDINDSLGHSAGDELLANVGAMLRERLRGSDVIARLGGDEFGILLTRVDATHAQVVAMHLLDRLRLHAIIVAGHPVTVTASIGIALFPEHGVTEEHLLAHADLAMYQAKESGRNGFTVYKADASWGQLVASRVSWEKRIREALDRDLFVLYAQPICDLHLNRITQYELLLRLKGEDGEIVPPTAFLFGIAERFGLIHAIDRWVVRQAIHLLADGERSGHPLNLSANLSGKAFGDAELLPMIRAEMLATGVNPENLTLEITQTAAIADLYQAESFIQTLTRLGCRFAIDDFGVGFSSFDYVRRIPAHYLKIDGSFIEHLPHDEVDQHLVRAIAEVAHSLHKETIAEFVGDEETVQLLRQFGVDHAQGYYIGRPKPISDTFRF